MRRHSEGETFRWIIENHPVFLFNRKPSELGMLGCPTFARLQPLNSNVPVRRAGSVANCNIPFSALLRAINLLCHHLSTLHTAAVRRSPTVASFRPKASAAQCFTHVHSRNSTDTPLAQVITCKLHISITREFATASQQMCGECQICQRSVAYQGL